MSNSLSKIAGSLLMLVALAVSATSVLGQPSRAEAIFEEAKSLTASANSRESFDQAFAKFDEAARLFRAAKNTDRLNEVELEHGRALRILSIRERDAKNYADAVKLNELAERKFKPLAAHQDLAYVYHDLGYLADQREAVQDSIRYYRLAIDEYRLSGEKTGEAAVLRNLGLALINEKKYPEALQNLQLAEKIYTEADDRENQGQLAFDIGTLHEADGKKEPAIEKFGDAYLHFRIAGNRLSEAGALYRMGMVRVAAYKYADAISSFQAAANVYGAINEKFAETEAIEQIGRAHLSVGEHDDAIPFLVRATEGFRALKDETREAASSLDLSIAYQGKSQMTEGVAALERSLDIFRNTDNTFGEAMALLIYAELESYLNKHDESLAKIRKAEKMFKAFPEINNSYRINRAYFSHYYMLSNHGEAIRYATITLVQAETDKDMSAQITSYVDLATSYAALGQRRKGNELTEKALAMSRLMGSRYMESICLSNIGYGYLKLGMYAEAQTNLENAIKLMQAYKYRREEGYATHNLGLVYYARKEYTKALAHYDRAYTLYIQAGDRRPESFLYDSYGELYRDIGQFDKAIENLQKALVLAREIRYSDIEAQALGNMMTLWMRRKQPRLGILYGKQAVNVYQNIRAGTKTLDKAEQKSFVQSHETTYRQLANLLIEEGRLAEAQQVLDLLKAEEYFEFVRRDSSEADEHAGLALNETERKALEEYSRVSSNLTALGVQFQILQDKRIKAGGKLPEAEEADYNRLKTQVETAGEGLKTFFTKLASEFSKKVEDGTVVTPQSIETLKADLRRAGSDVVLVSTYLLPERYRAIVTTGRTMVDRKVEYSALKLTNADINRKIFEFQRALQNPNVDPRKLGKELYDIFVKPLEGDLRGAGAKTILWSLDGSLRYIPFAALSPDGKTYMADTYQNVVVTLGRQTNLFVKPAADEWRAIGAGVSKQHAGFSALPSVPSEIGSIIRDQKTASGVLDGTRMLDEQFNLETLRNTVPQQTEDGKPFNVLHLATHFSLGANDQDSALLLGDGTRLSLFEIGRDEALDFKDVELLTLSACQTGISTGDANGREVESLGMLAQKKGAKAVMATLWKVADESTSMFMAEFYRIKKATPAMNKAEAIRLAQKAMIDGRIKGSGRSTACRGEQFSSGPKQNEFKCDPNAPYSHPYFWSPFVLIGNWR